jgi:hypothetical protein
VEAERSERDGVRRGVVAVDVESEFEAARMTTAIGIRVAETARMRGVAVLRAEGRGRDRTDVPVERRVAVRSRGGEGGEGGVFAREAALRRTVRRCSGVSRANRDSTQRSQAVRDPTSKARPVRRAESEIGLRHW